MKLDLKKIFDDFNSKHTIDKLGLMIASVDFSIWISAVKKPAFNFKIESTIPYSFDYDTGIIEWEYDNDVCFAGWKHNRHSDRFSRIML